MTDPAAQGRPSAYRIPNPDAQAILNSLLNVTVETLERALEDKDEILQTTRTSGYRNPRLLTGQHHNIRLERLHGLEEHLNDDGRAAAIDRQLATVPHVFYRT